MLPENLDFARTPMSFLSLDSRQDAQNSITLHLAEARDESNSQNIVSRLHVGWLWERQRIRRGFTSRNRHGHRRNGLDEHVCGWGRCKPTAGLHGPSWLRSARREHHAERSHACR